MRSREAPARGGPRAVRAVLLSSVSVGLGSAAHAAGGGCVQAEAVGGAALVLLAAAWVLARTEVSGPVLLCWLAATQVFVHVAMAASCTDATALSAGLLAAHALAVAGAGLALRLGEAGAWASSRIRAAARRLARSLASRWAGAVVPGLRWRQSVAVAAPEPGRVRSVLPGAVRRRGPPVGPALP